MMRSVHDACIDATVIVDGVPLDKLPIERRIEVLSELLARHFSTVPLSERSRTYPRCLDGWKRILDQVIEAEGGAREDQLATVHELPKRRQPGLVYFVQQRCDGGGGPIKIGVTGDLEARLRPLQISSPYPLDVLATMRGDDATEYALHARFAHARMSGEWFRPTADLLAFIAAIPAEAK